MNTQTPPTPASFKPEDVLNLVHTIWEIIVAAPPRHSIKHAQFKHARLEHGQALDA
jgi:hypothetical protein